MFHPKILSHVIEIFLILLVMVGCATFNPRPIDEVSFKQRALTQTKGKIRVTAAVLGAEESKTVFGVTLYRRSIQPVWLEIENNAEQAVWFLPAGLDRDYFPPLEVAYMHHFSFAKKANRKMDRYFYDQSMGNYVAPGSVRSGFVFTNLDMGTKGFNVDLIGEDDRIRTFTFFISVPGLRVDHREVEWEKLYSKNEIVDYDEMGLRKVLDNLPCCTTDKDPNKNGDPLNLIIIGHGEDVHHALIRSKWDETETASAVSKSSTAAKQSWQHRYEPVKPLYYSGRSQDAAFRKSRKAADERNQIRLWLSPMTFDGMPVWVGQISRIVSPRNFFKTSYIIEPNVDEARTYLIQDLLYSQGVAKFGYVKGVGVVPPAQPRKNLNNDYYFTDGYRIVLWLASEPVSFTEVEFIEWEVPGGREQ